LKTSVLYIFYFKRLELPFSQTLLALLSSLPGQRGSTENWCWFH